MYNSPFTTLLLWPLRIHYSDPVTYICRRDLCSNVRRERPGRRPGRKRWGVEHEHTLRQLSTVVWRGTTYTIQIDNTAWFDRVKLIARDTPVDDYALKYPTFLGLDDVRPGQPQRRRVKSLFTSGRYCKGVGAALSAFQTALSRGCVTHRISMPPDRD